MKKKNQLLKSVLVAIAAVTISGTAMAQVEIGVRAGANFSNVTMKDANDKKVDTKLNPGFHVGVTFDIPVADEFYVQPGALFNTKGFKTKSRSDFFDFEGESVQNAYYLEVPINFIYKPELGNGRMLLGAGPYVAYGLGGNWKVKGDLAGWEGSKDGKLEFVNDLKDQSDDADKGVYGKPFDAGANLLVGYEFANKFSVQLNGQLGLMNIEPKFDGKKPDGSLKNSQFGVSLGYKF